MKYLWEHNSKSHDGNSARQLYHITAVDLPIAEVYLFRGFKVQLMSLRVQIVAGKVG